MQISEKMIEAAARAIVETPPAHGMETRDGQDVIIQDYRQTAYAALEAALSTGAEPVALHDNDTVWARFYRDGKNLGEICSEFKCGVYDLSPWLTAPLTRAIPTAPAVAVKALQEAVKLTMQDAAFHLKKYRPHCLEALQAALSAQVQDDSEIVDCLLAGKPFVFDPATNFCHADDGGAPEHGIKYVPAAQVQDVAEIAGQAKNGRPSDYMQDVAIPEGWQFVPKEPTREMDYAGHDKFVDVSSSRYTGSDPHREIFNAMIAAAPAAKQGDASRDFWKDQFEAAIAECKLMAVYPGGKPEHKMFYRGVAATVDTLEIYKARLEYSIENKKPISDRRD